MKKTKDSSNQLSLPLENVTKPVSGAIIEMAPVPEFRAPVISLTKRKEEKAKSENARLTSIILESVKHL